MSTIQKMMIPTHPRLQKPSQPAVRFAAHQPNTPQPRFGSDMGEWVGQKFESGQWTTRKIINSGLLLLLGGLGMMRGCQAVHWYDNPNGTLSAFNSPLGGYQRDSNGKLALKQQGYVLTFVGAENYQLETRTQQVKDTFQPYTQEGVLMDGDGSGPEQGIDISVNYSLLKGDDNYASSFEKVMNDLVGSSSLNPEYASRSTTRFQTSDDPKMKIIYFTKILPMLQESLNKSSIYIQVKEIQNKTGYFDNALKTGLYKFQTTDKETGKVHTFVLTGQDVLDINKEIDKQAQNGGVVVVPGVQIAPAPGAVVPGDKPADAAAPNGELAAPPKANIDKKLDIEEAELLVRPLGEQLEAIGLHLDGLQTSGIHIPKFIADKIREKSQIPALKSKAEQEIPAFAAQAEQARKDVIAEWAGKLIEQKAANEKAIADATGRRNKATEDAKATENEAKGKAAVTLSQAAGKAKTLVLEAEKDATEALQGANVYAAQKSVEATEKSAPILADAKAKAETLEALGLQLDQFPEYLTQKEAELTAAVQKAFAGKIRSVLLAPGTSPTKILEQVKPDTVPAPATPAPANK